MWGCNQAKEGAILYASRREAHPDASSIFGVAELRRLSYLDRSSLRGEMICKLDKLQKGGGSVAGM